MKKISSLAAFLFLLLFSWVIPKKKNLIVFFPTHFKNATFNGNIKALYLYMIKSFPQLELVCINVTQEEVLANKDNNFRLKPKRYSFKNLVLMLRAEKIILDSGSNFFGRFNLYQLWHGTGFKNIGFLNKNNSFLVNLKYILMSKMLRMVVATSAADKERKEKSFQTNNVFITGSPRNDFLLDSTVDDTPIYKSIGIPSDSQVISYLPTFREKIEFSPFSDQFCNELNQWLEKTDRYFIIKKHPNDTQMQIDNTYSRFIDLSKRNIDTQYLLRISDILISDYSGVITDFALMRKPIILYAHDYKTYLLTCRDFYYYPDQLLNEGFIQDEKSLLVYLEQVTDNFDIKTNDDFLGKFHQYIDANSAQRVSELILKD